MDNLTDKCLCEDCFLYHEKKHYCSLDGKQHKGCYNNFMAKEKRNG